MSELISEIFQNLQFDLLRQFWEMKTQRLVEQCARFVSQQHALGRDSFDLEERGEVKEVA